MASVFTFDSDPPRVTSPWPTRTTANGNGGRGAETSVLAVGDMPSVVDLADCGITRLESEPQEGPTEYKLHLLLRPRRSFVASSTLQRVSGSHQSKSGSVRLDSQSDLKQVRLSPSPKPSSQSRQNRLQNLTTQLLWRLQQSSPYHSSSRSGLVVPVLPEDVKNLVAPECPDSLLPGLEESQGALYEIGVSDDGAFVGLTEDELEESLTTLRAMASSLGCKVEVLRKVIVGECQWFKDPPALNGAVRELHHDDLLVAEALVTPNFGLGNQVNLARTVQVDDVRITKTLATSMHDEVAQVESQTEQLRISLTGSTTSGKSSLLGTLSTSTLDNGRGKSRLSLLKHPHEIVSGISSSVTPELIGYQDGCSSDGGIPGINVINYASGNVSSWNDIHSASEPGRLVFAIDSAGHPRFRRTMLRGLISWAPHWTICCIAADGEGHHKSRSSPTAFSQEIFGSPADGVDMSRAHLNLCLKLKLPLVVVITKLDLASRTGLKQTLNKVLSTLKAAGRRTCLLPTTTISDQDPSLQSLRADDEDVVKRTIASYQKDDISLLVPIILTSTVNGTGISKLHALLRHLPLFNPKRQRKSQDPDYNLGPDILFHVDEVFAMSESQPPLNPFVTKSLTGTVLSGHLRYGEVSIGDQLLLGPFTVDASVNDACKLEAHRARSYHGIDKRSSRYLKLSREEYQPSSEEDAMGALKDSSSVASAWRRVRVESLRNLRLPVRKLLAGQVGTVGISWGHGEETADGSELAPQYRLRKGIIMTNSRVNSGNQSPSSYGSFCASFDENNTVSIMLGSIVIVYMASIRTTAKIMSISPSPDTTTSNDGAFCFDDDVSDSDGGVAVLDASSSKQQEQQQQQEVTFRFLASREWIELGSLVLVMPGGGGGGGGGGPGGGSGSTASPGERGNNGQSVGLDGFVGKVTRVLE